MRKASALYAIFLSVISLQQHSARGSPLTWSDNPVHVQAPLSASALINKVETFVKVRCRSYYPSCAKISPLAALLYCMKDISLQKMGGCFNHYVWFSLQLFFTTSQEVLNIHACVYQVTVILLVQRILWIPIVMQTNRGIYHTHHWLKQPLIFLQWCT